MRILICSMKLQDVVDLLYAHSNSGQMTSFRALFFNLPSFINTEEQLRYSYNPNAHNAAPDTFRISMEQHQALS